MLWVLMLGAQPSVAASSCPTSEAVLQALITGGGTVTLSCSGRTTIYFTSPITITKAVTLDASSSPGAITFDGFRPDGGAEVPLFNVTSSGSFTLNGVTLAEGHAQRFGGAINNNGTSTITNDTFSENRAGFTGGAIQNAGRLTVTNSTFVDNEAAVHGGAIANTATGTLAVVNSTFSANSASSGGAIRNDKTASIANSTFSENRAQFTGAAIDNAGTLSMGATIIAASLNGGNCGGTLTDEGYNLEDDAAAICGFSASGHDIVGQSPQLGSLASNGGPTQTMALGPGSPAIDRVPSDTGLCPATDQRGVQRPDGNESACDIGAYEYQDSCPSTESALQELISSEGVVTLSCAVATTIRFTSMITITGNVTLDASESPGSITLDGGGSVRLFDNFGTLMLDGVTLAHGNAGSGGAIYNEGTGTVTINHGSLQGNTATGSGGAIWNGGSLTVALSTLSGNSASDSGGAIDDEAGGALTIVNSTLSGNSASDGGAVANDNTASIANSTLSSNSASDEGGAISDTGTFTISGSIVSASAGDNCFSSGGIQDSGYNLEDDAAASCGFSQSTNDIVGQDPLLAPLGSNGGRTQTMALMAGSPAIDRIPTSARVADGSPLCPATDQRGAKRPDDNENVCDIGAYESSEGQLGQAAPPKIKLITCRAVTRTVVKRAGRRWQKARVRKIKCRATRVFGKVKLRGASRAHATLHRGRLVYATGASVSAGPGRLRLLVTVLRPLRPGRYGLTLRHRQHRGETIRRVTITLG
jgi:hypothetical protein